MGDRIMNNNNATSGTFYFMGFIGAAIFFIQHAASFWQGVLGILQALFWPAVIIYRIFQYLG
jgi:hypothetical protein